jgi:hypothetical protein
VTAHIAAALRHHLLLRDDTLKKMLPGPDATRPVHRSTAVRTRRPAAEPSQ